MAYPPHWGVSFTPTTHSKPAGPTLPTSNPLPTNFAVAITGAGKGLGYHIALAYAAAGAARISISSRTQADLDKLATEIANLNPEIKVHARTCDTTKDEDVKALAEDVMSTFGRIDAVIANAGIISAYITDSDGHRRLPVGIAADEDFDRVIAINVLGVARTAKYFVPHLLGTLDGGKAFVFISSLAGMASTSSVVPVAYTVSKVAGNKLVEVLAEDHRGEGLVAYAVHPGAVVTEQTKGHEGNGAVLVDDPGLCGGWLTWLTRERREWLSGRYVSVNWDVEELEGKRQEIVSGDKLKFRMMV
ncbi:NAD(P)-binding protein [Trichodelitschia bisporula]|uniref:NAD(P)-binding protein n=1 Tax=Trichodelitschia bisporula TaxID=703511 RepID=A0A6G1HMT1_9PEZI|nr:NAD(P)-binding protein [Trichodelitschia bisporula]